MLSKARPGIFNNSYTRSPFPLLVVFPNHFWHEIQYFNFQEPHISINFHFANLMLVIHIFKELTFTYILTLQAHIKISRKDSITWEIRPMLCDNWKVMTMIRTMKQHYKRFYFVLLLRKCTENTLPLCAPSRTRRWRPNALFRNSI